MEGTHVRDAAVEDAEAIASIYNHYVENSTATFDTEPKSPADRREWIASRSLRYPVIVAERAGRLVGWGALSAWASRPAWAGTVEVAVYVAPDARGAGVGSALLAAIVERARAADHHAVIAQVVSENTASVALMHSAGFERVGELKEVGNKFGRWLNVELLELIVGKGNDS